jgi:hypothetical protein
MIQKELENSIVHKLKLAKTVKEKREAVLTNNPWHYAFGQKRRAWKDYLTYEENMEEVNSPTLCSYPAKLIGERNANN